MFKKMWTICTLLPQVTHTRPSAARQKSCTAAGTQVQQVCSWRLSENTEVKIPHASIQSKLLWSAALSLNLAQLKISLQLSYPTINFKKKKRALQYFQ